MSVEESAVGQISDLQFEDGAAELRDSPDVQPDVGLLVTEVQGVGLQPELAVLVASNASQCSEDPAERAEAVYLGRLEPEAAMLFKAHFETCLRCRQEYADTVRFVNATTSAAAKMLESGDGSKAN
jgi:hypothetical protein